jgi:hypothetical protein
LPSKPHEYWRWLDHKGKAKPMIVVMPLGHTVEFSMNDIAAVPA